MNKPDLISHDGQYVYNKFLEAVNQQHRFWLLKELSRELYTRIIKWRSWLLINRIEKIEKIYNLLTPTYEYYKHTNEITIENDIVAGRLYDLFNNTCYNRLIQNREAFIGGIHEMIQKIHDKSYDTWEYYEKIYDTQVRIFELFNVIKIIKEIIDTPIIFLDKTKIAIKIAYR